MKPAKRFELVLVTAPNLKTARRLARAALTRRLIACANILPGIESCYWWKDKIEQSTEVLIILKTTTERLAGLENLIVSCHPYDTPEFIVLNIHQGNRRYLNWLSGAVQ